VSKSGVISNSDVYNIFCNVKDLEKFQKEFLVDLQANRNDVGSIFLKWGKKFSIYTPYCINQEQATELVTTHRAALLKAGVTLEPDFTLPSYLLKPVQRICKYPLLLREMIKHTEPESPESKVLNAALSEMKTVTVFINELKRRRESMRVVAELEDKIENWKGCDLRCYGELKMDDTMDLVTENGKKQEMHFFLFEKLLMYATESFKKKDSTYHMKGKLQLKETIATVQTFQKKDGFFFQLDRKDDPTKSIVVRANSAEQQKAWESAILSLIKERTQKQNTLRGKGANAVKRASLVGTFPDLKIEQKPTLEKMNENPDSPATNKAEETKSQQEENRNSLRNSEDICPYCQEICTDFQQLTIYEDQKWHQEHFNCMHCNQNLSHETFYTHDLNLYCKHDFVQLFSPRCFACGNIIEEEYIEHIGVTWHREHFKCAHCEVGLDGQSFFEVDGMAYCVNDYNSLFGSKCHVCDGFILEGGLECAGLSFHASCFGCHECRTPLLEKDFFDFEGEIYCELHFYSKHDLLCKKCELPIKDAYVQIDGFKYHESCYE